jgi:hypothetical protein
MSAVVDRDQPTVDSALASLTLPDSDGNEHRLGELWERRPAVLLFIRHFG